MKKNQQDEEEDEDGQDLEIIKAVAQAWHGHSGSSRTTSEFNAHRHSFKTRPTRFKFEAAATKVSVSSSLTTSDKNGFTSWDFGQSLLDSYEIVAVSKKLETGCIFVFRIRSLIRVAAFIVTSTFLVVVSFIFDDHMKIWITRHAFNCTYSWHSLHLMHMIKVFLRCGTPTRLCLRPLLKHFVSSLVVLTDLPQFKENYKVYIHNYWQDKMDDVAAESDSLSYLDKLILRKE